MIIVGSQALFNLGEGSQPNDLDVWLPEGCELEVNGADCSFMPQDVMDRFSDNSKKWGSACPKDLLAIKLSHLPYDIFWWKHLQSMLHIKGLTKGGYNVRLYESLCRHWNKVHTKDHLSLYRTRDQFFDDFVVKQYEHDWLHELVAHYGAPIYTRVLKDGQEVLVCREKFDNLPYTYKVQMWCEEIAVIALERWVIPSKGKINYLQAWHRSLHKVVTALTKGWASEWIIMNIEEFLTPLYLPSGVWEKLNIKESKMELKNIVDLFNEKLGKEVFYEEGSVWGSDDEDEEAEYSIEEFLIDGYKIDEHPEVEHIKTEGGGEGGSEDVATVVKIKDTYYEVCYSYYSHEGYNFEWLTCNEVKPVQRMVTFYE